MFVLRDIQCNLLIKFAGQKNLEVMGKLTRVVQIGQLKLQLPKRAQKHVQRHVWKVMIVHITCGLLTRGAACKAVAPQKLMDTASIRHSFVEKVISNTILPSS